MKRKVTLFVCLLLTLAGAGAGARSVVTAEDTAANYEVWVIDQSDTRPDGGGTLYVYQGGDLEGADAAAAVPEMVDLGGAARDLCIGQTGTAPRRPHMFFFSPSRTHAAVAFVTTGHVLFMDVVTKAPVGCVDVGVQAHAAVPSNDGTFVVVANQNGRLLQRINTDYATNTFTLDAAATIDLATCTTPSGAPCQDPVLRPSNRPICPVIDESDNFTFVTLAGGGLFVVDSRATPMAIIGEYDKDTVHPEGCGGVEAGGRMYINSGGPLESDLYSFPLAGYTGANPPNTPAPTLVFTHDGTVSDSHGAIRTKHERFVWVAERFGNNITVVDTEGNSVVNQFSLVGPVSDDPTPDLMDISPGGNRVFMALRGPNPLSGNNPTFNNAAGSTPGIGIIRVEQGGRRGEFFARVPISRVVAGIERADPHGLKVLVK
ncbi:MAG TPA: hypothetical protein VFZ44_06855 [Pyrinomonadaceae bacterium]